MHKLLLADALAFGLTDLAFKLRLLNLTFVTAMLLMFPGRTSFGGPRLRT